MDRESGKTQPEADVWPKVILGWDTRESSLRLLELMKKGISVLKVPIQELGLVTTPQLHYVTMNHQHSASVDTYINDFAQAYIDFQAVIRVDGVPKTKYEPRIAIDCANGVGSIHVATVA